MSIDFSKDRLFYDCFQSFLNITEDWSFDNDKDLNSLIAESVAKFSTNDEPECYNQIARVGWELRKISESLGTEGKEIASIAEGLLQDKNSEVSAFANEFVHWILKPKAEPYSPDNDGGRGGRDRGGRDRGGRDRGGRDRGGRERGGRERGGRDRGGRSQGNFKKGGKNHKTPEESKAAATVENGIRALKANGNLVEIDLEASNSFHRRLQHKAVTGSGFFSYSKGDGDERRVVLTREKPIPKDDDELDGENAE